MEILLHMGYTITAIADQHAPSADDKNVAKADIYATRPLSDGREFTIVKAFYDLADLEKKLEGLGFEVRVDKFTDTFFFLTGRRKR